MKYFIYILVFVPLTLFSQHAEIGVFGGPYWSNQNLENQGGRHSLGVELSHHFNKNETIVARFLYGETDFYYDFYDDLFMATPGNSTNTIKDDFNVSFLYGREFWLNEFFSISTHAGLSLIISQYGSVGRLRVSNPETNASYSIEVGPNSDFDVAFPVSTGINYQTANNRWGFQLGGGATVHPDYGLISLYAAPKVNLTLGKIREDK